MNILLGALIGVGCVIVFYISLFIGFSVAMKQHQNKCEHQWKLTKSGNAHYCSKCDKFLWKWL